MRLIIVIIIAAVLAAAGWFIGDYIWGDREVAITWTNDDLQDGFRVGWRCFYAAMGANLGLILGFWFTGRR